MQHFEHVVRGARRKHAGCYAQPFNVVEVVRCPSRRGEPVGEIVAQPFGSIRTDQDKIEVVDQARLRLSGQCAARLVRPGQRDVKAVRRVQSERVQQAKPWREHLFVVHKRIESGGSVHGQHRAFKVYFAPTLCGVGHIGQAQISGTVDHRCLDQSA